MNETLVVIVRAVIGFFSLLIFARVLGKQTISQLTFFDYILGITIGSIAASLTVDLTSSAWPHFVGLSVWVLLVYVMQYIVLKWRHSSKYISGESTIIIIDGKIMESALGNMRYEMGNLMGQIRAKGVFDISEVALAVLETNGQVSVLKKGPYQEVTKKDLNIPSTYQGMGKELIYDGMLINKHLDQLQLSEQWLFTQLKNRGLSNEKEVFLAIIDHSGKLFIDEYDDYLNNGSDKDFE